MAAMLIFNKGGYNVSKNLNEYNYFLGGAQATNPDFPTADQLIDRIQQLNRPATLDITFDKLPVSNLLEKAFESYAQMIESVVQKKYPERLSAVTEVRKNGKGLFAPYNVVMTSLDYTYLHLQLLNLIAEKPDALPPLDIVREWYVNNDLDALIEKDLTWLMIRNNGILLPVLVVGDFPIETLARAYDARIALLKLPNIQVRSDFIQDAYHKFCEGLSDAQHRFAKYYIFPSTSPDCMSKYDALSREQHVTSMHDIGYKLKRAMLTPSRAEEADWIQWYLLIQQDYAYRNIITNETVTFSSLNAAYQERLKKLFGYPMGDAMEYFSHEYKDQFPNHVLVTPWDTVLSKWVNTARPKLTLQSMNSNDLMHYQPRLSYVDKKDECRQLKELLKKAGHDVSLMKGERFDAGELLGGLLKTNAVFFEKYKHVFEDQQETTTSS